MAKSVPRIIRVTHLERARVSHERAPLQVGATSNTLKVGRIDTVSYTAQMVPLHARCCMSKKKEVGCNSFSRVDKECAVPISIGGGCPEPAGTKMRRIFGDWSVFINLLPKTLLWWPGFMWIHSYWHQNNLLSFDIYSAIVTQQEVCHR